MPTAKIIRERPAQNIPEYAFNALGNCLWVLFEDEDYVQWCGIFGGGRCNWSEGKVIKLSESDFGVLVAGRLYFVNANQRELRFSSEEDNLEDIIYADKHDLLIACNWGHLFSYSPSGLCWKSDRVSINGIKLTGTFDNRLNGYVDAMNNVETPFILFLDSMHFECDIDRRWFDVQQ